MKTKNNLNADEPPSGYSPLEQIILEIYIDHIEIITAVRKHSFEATLYPVLKKANDYIESNNYESIPNIVGTLLTTINDKLAEVVGREKEILEELASELFKEQLTILNSTKEGQLCWQECLPIIKETCEFKDYDYTSLSQLMGFNYVKKIPHSKKVSEKKLPYYEWTGVEDQYLELIRDLKDKQWISNINEFKKIFKPIQNPNYRFRASIEKIDHLLILFSELKSRELITPRKNKGHFYPLFRYGMDFDEKLFKKQPKKYMEALKKNKPLHSSILNEVDVLIKSNLG